MFDAVQKIALLGRRLAEAGRQARGEVAAAAGPMGRQVVEAAAVAAGELVRCAVAGAITAAVRGACPRPRRANRPVEGWDDRFDLAEEIPDETDEGEMPTANAAPTEVNSANAVVSRPRWASATRAVGTALTVAAGAAASVPGGRLVAAGLGGLAAVAGLAVRVAEPTPES